MVSRKWGKLSLLFCTQLSWWVASDLAHILQFTNWYVVTYQPFQLRPDMYPVQICLISLILSFLLPISKTRKWKLLEEIFYIHSCLQPKAKVMVFSWSFTSHKVNTKQSTNSHRCICIWGKENSDKLKCRISNSQQIEAEIKLGVRLLAC